MIKPDVFKNPVHFLAFGFGSGLAAKAPGTFGTLVAIPFFLLVYKLSFLYYFIFVVVTFILGVYVCDRTSKDMKVHDHGGIVWDEMVGYWITMMVVPLALVPMTWVSMLGGFLLFRLFDIWKPWPIKWCDKHVTGGFGIMIDDVLAGLLAFFFLFFSYSMLPEIGL